MNATMARPRSRGIESGFGYSRHRSRLLLRSTKTEVIEINGKRSFSTGNTTQNYTPNEGDQCETTLKIIGDRTPIVKKGATTERIKFPLPQTNTSLHATNCTTARSDSIVQSSQRIQQVKKFRRTISCGACRVSDLVSKLPERSQSRAELFQAATCSSSRPVSRRPHTAMSKLSKNGGAPPSWMSVSSRVRSCSDGMDTVDNDYTDLSSEVEELRPVSFRAVGSGRAEPARDPGPVPQLGAPRPAIPEISIDKDVYNKCRAWVATLPERFSGLNNVLSIPSDVTEGNNVKD